MKAINNSKNRPNSAEKSKKLKEPDFSKQRVKFEESSIEKEISKESWSKLANTELEILNEIGSPAVKPKEKHKVEVETILEELKSLKEENRVLREKLKIRTGQSTRSESKIRQRASENKGNKLKHCMMCAKLLSKGYTTRFCPVHGHRFKVFSSANLF